MSHSNKPRERADEPIFWGLFGGGGVVAAFATPVLILITGLLVPLGILQLEYANVAAFANHWIGKIVIVTVISLPMWHACHRIFHAMHDFKIDTARGFFKLFWYGLAFAVTVACVAYLVTL
ncbi:fumarate reductase subunit FrdD [Echinimonas agarilytica]|uniref:Fumarate reductase subunit D n=1 Tax=Echinimonas agarilytica TaxID=1215918 RepID=A0AA42B681_9GAMM|nr:fumarate reductase subunit FrdD [Echinimonas agarilytica]MCM2678430.1 fumarate reductase subunit FrdD [Echinimonas agarilytica]